MKYYMVIMLLGNGILKFYVKSWEFYFTLLRWYTWVFYPSGEWFDILNCRIREERWASSSRSSFSLVSIIIPNTTIRFSELPALSRYLSICFWNSLRSGYSSNRRSRSSRAALPISINSCLLSVLFFLSKLKRFPMISILKQKSCQ